MSPHLPPEIETHPAAPRGAETGTDPVLVLVNEAGRDAFLARAERFLPEGEAIVRVKDLVGVRRSFRTTPTDARATLVAREVPVVLRGGLTSLVSYYRVPVDALDAVETHYEGREVSHTYEVILSIARLGKAPRRAAPLAA